MKQKHENLKAMLECAIMAALAAVLSTIRIIKLPLGGSVTLLSMLPICLFAIRRGTRWGLICGFLHGFMQLAFDFGEVIGWGLTPAALAGCIVFDYLIAFTVIGFSGIFRAHGRRGVISGTVFAIVLRFLSHLLSGVLLASAWLPDSWDNPFLYSVCYNGAFMLPELIFTAAAVWLLSGIPAFSGLSEPRG